MIASAVLPELQRFAESLWSELGSMAPFLLFGFLAAGFLSVLLPAEGIERHLGGRGVGSILKSTLLGIPLPLCSCSVLPVAASLARHGASRSATAAFLLSAPQTGADSILVTFSLLGPVFAVFRPLAALLSGLLGGMLISLSEGKEASAGHARGNCSEPCCARDDRRNVITKALQYGFRTLPRDIGKPLLVGLLIAAAITALVPEDFFSRYVGGGLGAMLLMMVVGLPVYVCATASVPIAAALIAKGVSPGAALVFLTTGPATNAAAVALIWKLLGARSALFYLLAVVATALTSGVALNLLFSQLGATRESLAPSMLPVWFQAISAVCLLAVLGAAFIPSRRPAHSEHAGEEEHPGAPSEKPCCRGG